MMSVGTVDELEPVNGFVPTMVYGYVTPFVGSVNWLAQNGIVFAFASGVTPPCELNSGVSPAVSRTGSGVFADAVAAKTAATAASAASRTTALSDGFKGCSPLSFDDPGPRGVAQCSPEIRAPRAVAVRSSA